MSLGSSGLSGVKILWLITGLRDSQSLSGLVDSGVGDMEPEKSEDDVFLATTHDVEEIFLGDPFDVHVQGTGIVDGTCFIHGLIDILNNDKGCKFLSGELVFPD